MRKVMWPLLVLMLGAPLAQAQDVSLKERLMAMDFYKQSYDVVFAAESCRRVDSLLKDLRKLSSRERAQAEAFIAAHEAKVPEKILLPLVYWKFIKKNAANETRVMKFWLQTRLQVLRDYADDPLKGDTQSKQSARELMSTWAGATSLNMNSPELTQDLRKTFPAIDDYSLVAGGFIPGNVVELVSHNEISPERIQWFNDRVIFAGGKLDFSQPYMKMPLNNNDEGHPSFKDPMFAKIRDMILSAKESIFIDIFLFGGTMGGTLSKFLLEQTAEKRKVNPNFRVLLLHDFATNYNMKDEMMPIFRYIRDEIATNPALKGSVYLLQANIQRHPPGIPFGITNLVPRTEETFKSLEKRNTYYESKIDHSKVIVVDAESDAPQAYFGSKNWSDHSGGYYYDNALYVKGPAAAMVQAAYYDDVDAALTLNKEERKWFYFKEEGFSNEAYLKNRDDILSWFKVKRSSYPPVGNQVVRLAEANVDGKIKDTRNMLVDMISKAQSHIYMEHLFIYDKYINDALMKRKLQVPKLKIRILADHNGNFKLGGLPNTLYLDQMLEHKVEVKARKTLGIEAHFPNGTKQEYHQENHRKITSVDGKVLLVGSSNLNPDTLQGSFREFGAQIYDTQVISQFEKEFEKDWNDTAKVGPFYEGDKLRLQVLGQELSPELSRMLNNLGSQVLRAKDDIEKR
ncbi:MAG: phosphatidylserine/phosphatidylglycerophosphate/cardiolipin synthase family protein [Bdellovibrio sp.]